MLSVVVLISGGGSNLRALLEASEDAEFPARVVAIGADRPAEGFDHAEHFGIPTFSVALSNFDDRDAWGDELLQQIQFWQPDLVVLSGFMKLLPARVVDALAPNLINTHPAYLPEFPGAHGVRDALAAGATETGASVIVVDNGVDSGPIIAQQRVPIEPGDTESTLHDRIKPVERRLLIQAVLDIANSHIDLKELVSGPSHDPADYRTRDLVPVRRALVSVSDKSGLLELAAALAAAGVEIVSTGSTASTIANAGHRVTEVSSITGFPESLDGRVKTLHPVVHAGILADLRLESHEQQLAELGIAAFDLVVVNLYPFVETVASGAVGDDVVEQIDIGGPAMVRASAKNHANVAIVTSPDSYGEIHSALAAGGTTLAQRRSLAAQAFAHTASYDTAVAEWFAGQLDAPSAVSTFVSSLSLDADLQATLRYGENSHQAAALYATARGAGIAQAEQLGGKEMSYNNFVDADAALRAAYDHDTPAVAIIKHANPCGIATADTIADAHAAAHACDPVSAFGGVIASNRPITKAAAESIAPIFTEVVVAPDFEPEALEILQAKKNLRLLKLPAGFAAERTVRGRVEVRQISGGLLAQVPDTHFAPAAEWQLVTGDAADAATLADLEFAWRACRAVKSNAILLATSGASVGVGMGQVNRVDSCKLAVERAGERAAGSVAASDAFFPFADGLQILLDAGVRAVVQPGGSIRDEEVIAAAAAAGVTMYFTGERHFFH